MFCIAIFLPLVLIQAAGGFSGVNTTLEAIGTAEEKSLTGIYTGMLGIGFIIGNISIGFGYPGQPFVVNRFMAAKDINTIKRGKYIAMFWALIIFSGMILLGLTAKVMYTSVSDPETVLFFVSESLFGPVFAGIITAAVLSAIMSTADSQLLTVATSVNNDWNNGKNKSLSSARLAIILVVIAAALFSLFAPDTIFDRVVFAWTALGAAFVPMVLSKVFGWIFSGRAALISILCGFILTIVFHYLPNTPGDILERSVPMAMGMLTLFVSRKR
jgi:Na+/proline symporter